MCCTDVFLLRVEYTRNDLMKGMGVGKGRHSGYGVFS